MAECKEVSKWKEDERLRRIRELQLKLMANKGRVELYLAELGKLRGDYQ